MMRRFLVAALALAGLSCGDADTFDPFYLRLRAPSGMEGAGPAILPGAVDRIEVILDPADNVRFDEMVFPELEGGDAVARISPAGEYVISFNAAWIDRNREDTDVTWLVTIPLYIDGVQMEAPANPPQLRVRFVQSGAFGDEAIAEDIRTFPWPPEPGVETTIQLICAVGAEMECQTPTR